MRTHSSAYSLSDFLQHLLQEVIISDAQAQILQQTGWIAFRSAIPDSEGISLTEGIGQLEYLHLQEVKLTFRMAPVRKSCWARFKGSLGPLFGRKRAPEQLFRLIPEGSVDEPGATVTVAIGRADDGRFILQSDIQQSAGEEMHVPGLSS